MFVFRFDKFSIKIKNQKVLLNIKCNIELEFLRKKLVDKKV